MLMVPDPEANNLSPNHGPLSKKESCTLLAANYGKSAEEIGALITDANQNAELPYPFGGVLHY